MGGSVKQEGSARCPDFGIFGSFFQNGVEKGIQQGIQLGIQQGKQQGLQQGKQEMILRLLRQKFGRVPEVVVQKVQVIDDLDILEELFDGALMADTLAEIKSLA